MSKFTLGDALAMQARCDAARKVTRQPVLDPSDKRDQPESKLHRQIEDECRRRNWYFVHARMDKPTTVSVGTPDFIIAGSRGMTFWIECKAKGRKTKPAQAATQAWLQRDGHRSATVWSFEEFVSFIDKA